MRTLRILLTVFLAFAMTLTLIACGGKPAEKPSADNAGALDAGEPLGFHYGLAGWTSGDLDDLFQAAPPTEMVSFTLPSGSGCSKTVCPRFLASMVAFSTAYAWTKRSRCFGSPHEPSKLS